MMKDGIAELMADAEIPTEEQQPQNIHSAAPAENGGNRSTETEVFPENNKPELSAELIESGADFAIGFFDIALTQLLKFMLKRKKNKKVAKLFGESGLIKFQALMDEVDAADNNKVQFSVIREFNSDELKMLHLSKKASEILEDLPLTDEEKELIKIPLMEIMKQKGGTIPPQYQLLLGVMQIAGGRVAEIAML